MLRILAASFVVGAAAVVAAGATTPQASMAKSAAWVISGGELGQRAYVFDPGNSSIPVEAEIVTPPYGEHGPPYEIYMSWGTFAVALQVSLGKPWLTYYPDAALLRERPLDRPETWRHVTPEQAEPFEDAVAAALLAKEQGALEPNPIVADLRAREVHKGQLTFLPSHHAGVSFHIVGEVTERLVLGELPVILLQGPAGEFQGQPQYSIRIWVGRGDGGWGGTLGHYSPPAPGPIPSGFDGVPGRFAVSAYREGEANPYYVTTPEFDTIVEQARREAAASASGAIESETVRSPLVGSALDPAPTSLPNGRSFAQRTSGPDWRWVAMLFGTAGLLAGAAVVPVARSIRRRRNG